MQHVDRMAQLTRLLDELVKLETELRTMSLRDPQTLAAYADRISELRRDLGKCRTEPSSR